MFGMNFALFPSRSPQETPRPQVGPEFESASLARRVIMVSVGACADHIDCWSSGDTVLRDARPDFIIGYFGPSVPTARELPCPLVPRSNPACPFADALYFQMSRMWRQHGFLAVYSSAASISWFKDVLRAPGL